jgi:hypothetical protein
MISKNISKLGLLILVASLIQLMSCKDNFPALPDQPIDKYTQVYMPQAVNQPTVNVLKITDSIQTVTFGAELGGFGYVGSDIPITFKINKAAADSFNVANKTAYPLLPDNTYTMSALSAVIPKGGLSTAPLNISFITKGASAMDALKTFILPVSIAGSSIKVNENLRTTCFLVTSQPDFANYPNYDRTNWQVIDYSSQESSGEGPNNGRAIFAIDGDVNTYWHSKWTGTAAVPPHYITIDMGAVNVMHGLSFVGRQSTANGKPNEVNVQISTDNVTWANAGTFNLLNNTSLQKQFLPLGFNKSARYFKVIVNSAYSTTVTQIAELNAF